MRTIPPAFRNPVYHFRGPSTFPSPYNITAEALKNYGVSAELFGSTTVLISKEVQFNVKDYQYPIAQDEKGNVTEVGMYFLPVSDSASVPDQTGKLVPGGQVLDNWIMEKTGIGPNDQIYAFISYMHPEENQGSIAQLSLTDKAQLGFSHMGSYLGSGITSNSPEAYHNHRFGCAWNGTLGIAYGYPCNVHIVSLNGVDQSVFNRNCQLVDLMLGHGIEFPGNYQDSIFRPVYVNAALMFYRDWLMQEAYLMNDPSWSFYCAANKLTVLNIACNLPHNINAFKEVYGETQGAAVWAQFLLRYTNATGFSFTYYPGLATDFNPLWKQEGLSASDIVPFTIDQYNAFDAHRRLGTAYNGPMPVLPPLALACSAQSTADIVNEFIQIYADPYDAGPLSTVAVIWGTKPAILQRTGITDVEYVSYTLGIFQKLVLSDARSNAAITPSPNWITSQWFLTTYQTLVMIFGGTTTGTGSSVQQNTQKIQSFVDMKLTLEQVVAQNTAGQTVQPEMLAVFSLIQVILTWTTIIQAGIISREEAYIEFAESVQADFQQAENLVVTNPDKIQYNILPAAFNLISNGLYGANKLVTIKTICTAVDTSEIQLQQ